MLSYIDAIPAKTTVARGESPNVLGGAVNHDEKAAFDISVWGSIGEGWRPLATRRFEIGRGEHKHLYFTLPPGAFSRDVWGEDVDELAICVRADMPGPQEPGVLVFVE